jgi:hypothetical protein
MDTRKIHYVTKALTGEAATPSFHIQVASSEGGVNHAVATPRAWHSIDVPIETDPTAPRLESLHIEDMKLGQNSGVIACGSYPKATYTQAKDVAEALMARDGYTIQRWNDEDDDTGGARTLATTDTHTCALRVLPYEGLWVFVTAVIPTARMDEIGGVLHAAIVTFALAPGWSHG